MSIIQYGLRLNCTSAITHLRSIKSTHTYNQVAVRYLWSNLHKYNLSFIHNVQLFHTTCHRLNQQQSNNTTMNQSIPNNRRRLQLNDDLKAKNRRTAQYSIAFIIFCIGMGYAAVPLYRAFCRVTGFGGTVQESTVEQYEKSRLKPGTRDLTISFTADIGGGMPWEFYPTQQQIQLRIGEPALAFFTAKNKMTVPITGVATYNVTPMKAGLYFHKIQCMYQL